ncbi:MAG: molybdopterin cofactor-binding domain-containing protein, partial [Pseudomonadales bacterium]
MNEAKSATGIGASVKRKEDVRFITGSGCYTDDINQPGQSHAAFLRSPYARARIESIDSSAALEIEGVIAVLTGADMVADGLGDIPCGWLVKQKDGSDMVSAPHPPMAATQTNYVGEPYGVVIADTLAAARLGMEAVLTDFAELDAIVDLATVRDSEQIHEGVEGNLAFDWELGEREATEAALASAAHVTRLDLTNNRLIPNAMEPRAALGIFDKASGEHTLYTT